jgi:hypothetical protein
MGVTEILRAGSYVAGLMIAIPALLAGLFALEVHPIAGTLMLLAAMALLLSVLSDLCHPGRGIQKSDLQQKH